MGKIAIIGSTGYIAQFLIRRMQEELKEQELVFLDRTINLNSIYFDLEHPEAFDYDLLNDIELVILTAAISSPDMCANEYELCYKVNVLGTSYFITEALKRQCKVLFFSSDAVFGSTKNEYCDECSDTLADTPYGRMKKEIEDSFKYNSLFKAIRLSYVVSKKDKFVSYCLDCINTGTIAEIYHPFYRNCITVSDVVDVVLYLEKNWEKVKSPFINVAGTELISRVRIADEINVILNNKLDYKISKPPMEFFKNRPVITRMKSNYLNTILTPGTFSEKFKVELEEN